MKKLMAVLLTSCLVFQALASPVLPVYRVQAQAVGAESSSEEEQGKQGSKVKSGEEAVNQDTPSQLDSLPGEDDSSEADSSSEADTESQPSQIVPADEDADPLEDSAGEADLLENGTDADGVDPLAEEALDEEKIEQTKVKSALEVELIAALPFEDKEGASATVAVKGTGVNETKSLSVSGGHDLKSLARFNVPEGSYTVTVRANKFADYEQNISVTPGNISKVQVYSAQIETGGQISPGWLRLGDVNGDHKITEKDKKLLLDAIHSNSKDTELDLNRDGKVDIADLQCMVQSINENRESNIETLALPQGAIQSEGTQVTDGSISGMLDNAGSVTLKPKNENISQSNPVGLEFKLEKEDGTAPALAGMTIQTPVVTNEKGKVLSDIKDGMVIIETDSGQIEIPIGDGTVVASGSQSGRKAAYIARESQSGRGFAAFLRNLAKVSDMSAVRAAASNSPKVTLEADGSLILDFGGQVAVKRVTIRITGTRKNQSLAEISKVEFVNDMESRIPAPQLSIPEIKEILPENKQLTVSWSAQTNVTGYEICISDSKAEGAKEQTVRVAKTEYMLSSFLNGKLKNFEPYYIKVRSVNGNWKSPWSEVKEGRPQPTKVPAPPDFVKAEGGYLSVHVSWKDMDDADGYMLYYREHKESSSEEFRPVAEGFTETKEGTNRLSNNSYTITGLKNGVEYEVYVKGWNQLGWGGASITALAVTKNTSPPLLPKYKLLNTSNGAGMLTAHIQSATAGSAQMVESKLDEGKPKSALGTVDDDYASYWIKEGDWEDGVQYPSLDKGITITFDAEYEMDYLTFGAADQKYSVNAVRINYWDSEAVKNKSAAKNVGARLMEKKDSNNNPYYIVRFDQAVKLQKIQISIGRSWYYRAEMKIGEIHFHKYDSLPTDIMGLYEDEMHTVLKPDVTEQTIQSLSKRLEMPDSESSEKHPLYQELKLELELANDILHSNADAPYVVDNRITAQKDSHLGFGGLNAWQPLGRAVEAGETLIVYVGHNTKKIGDSADLQLVMTQHHSEASGFSRTASLKVGRNEITVPSLSSKVDDEWGGQLYVAYTQNNKNDQYAVRVSGGTKIPSLSVYKKTGEDRTKAIEQYVKDLESCCKALGEDHAAKHKNNHNKKAYSETVCVFNATDIMMDAMMYSVPATQIWKGIANQDDKVAALDRSLASMEDMMALFYHHKGLSDKAGKDDGNNALPSQHLNIRYMRMFAGAFMYASGNHIGVEFGSAAFGGRSSMNSFGWGIAHEIGHNINQGSYSVAEITNNYFAQLLTIKAKGTRFKDENVYKKVTSGAIGRDPNVGTQLALYWQLHLAYDNNKDDWHVYDSYKDQFDNLFFARVDTYSRNPGKAPQEGLKLDGGADQNIARLACAAANKNILPFFERWGIVPDKATKEYAAKYGEPETKALYYVNGSARDYRTDHPDEAEGGAIKGKDAIKEAKAQAQKNSSRVTVAITASDTVNRDALLGYEVIRKMTSDGKEESQVVGFQPFNRSDEANGVTEFVDTVYAVNNRVLTYEVKAVDKYLNYSKEASAGSVKLETGGVLDKSLWTASTNMTSADDTNIEIADDEDSLLEPDSGYNAGNPASVKPKTQNSIERIMDNQSVEESGIYKGTNQSGAAAYITIDMHKTEQVTSLQYLGDGIPDVTVEVSEDGSKWTAVKENYAGLGGGGQYETIWFDSVEESERSSWIGTYDARYVKLTFALASEIQIKEIEICGPTGDNLEFYQAGNTEDVAKLAVGTLAADYQYGSKAEDVIPKGSLVFAGTYKGNPAYNTVLLYDGKGNVVGAKDGQVEAYQVIFAKVPEKGNLGETSDGTWVYYLEPKQWNEDTIQSIRENGGVRGELYRVDNALTQEGERIVSDTLIMDVPAYSDLPTITLTGRTDK